MSLAPRYSRVSRRMWTDERFRALSAPKPNAQTLWKRLLTGPELTNVPGLFPARLAGLADALKWPVKATEACWNEIAKQGMARADWEAGLVWVPRAIVHNRPESPNVVKSWGPTVAELPECELRNHAVAALRVFLEDMGEGFRKAFAEAFQEGLPEGKSKGLPYQDQDQDQDQDQEGGAGAPAPGKASAKEGLPDPTRAGFDLDALDQGIAAATGASCHLDRHWRELAQWAQVFTRCPEPDEGETRADVLQREGTRFGAWCKAKGVAPNRMKFVDWLNLGAPGAEDVPRRAAGGRG